MKEKRVGKSEAENETDKNTEETAGELEEKYVQQEKEERQRWRETDRQRQKQGA